jgi:hypothetical protein
VAPISWLVAGDVHEGREELNFSMWNQYSTKERVKKLHQSWEEIEEGEMPLWFYTAAHREAKLSPEDRATLRTWSAELLPRERDQDHKEPDDEKDRSSR